MCYILPILPNTAHFQLCSLYEIFFENKIANINNIKCVSTPSILNLTIYITHPIDSLSIFTIPSLYEVNDLLMKFTVPPPLIPNLSHYIINFHHYFLLFLDIIIAKFWLGFTLPQDCHNISYSKKIKP